MTQTTNRNHPVREFDHGFTNNNYSCDDGISLDSDMLRIAHSSFADAQRAMHSPVDSLFDIKDTSDMCDTVRSIRASKSSERRAPQSSNTRPPWGSRPKPKKDGVQRGRFHPDGCRLQDLCATDRAKLARLVYELAAAQQALTINRNEPTKQNDQWKDEQPSTHAETPQKQSNLSAQPVLVRDFDNGCDGSVESTNCVNHFPTQLVRLKKELQQSKPQLASSMQPVLLQDDEFTATEQLWKDRMNGITISNVDAGSAVVSQPNQMTKVNQMTQKYDLPKPPSFNSSIGVHSQYSDGNTCGQTERHTPEPSQADRNPDKHVPTTHKKRIHENLLQERNTLRRQQEVLSVVSHQQVQLQQIGAQLQLIASMMSGTYQTGATRIEKQRSSPNSTLHAHHLADLTNEPVTVPVRKCSKSPPARPTWEPCDCMSSARQTPAHVSTGVDETQNQRVASQTNSGNALTAVELRPRPLNCDVANDDRRVAVACQTVILPSPSATSTSTQPIIVKHMPSHQRLRSVPVSKSRRQIRSLMSMSTITKRSQKRDSRAVGVQSIPDSSTDSSAQRPTVTGIGVQVKLDNLPQDTTSKSVQIPGTSKTILVGVVPQPISAPRLNTTNTATPSPLADEIEHVLSIINTLDAPASHWSGHIPVNSDSRRLHSSQSTHQTGRITNFIDRRLPPESDLFPASPSCSRVSVDQAEEQLMRDLSFFQF
ncbi:hypothetical protein EG68_07897 [Paragonimus skrjabini miyazakii]|uniref:Uncharacterized protein n=1 Tax=Paragonimus skrjabini miyazakii TaxID=59628 RepID=A0A8S9YAX4_9TREM|nr:hypothetical protein EG68_07897 [Paragonimus skrjabini miyazakii]